MGSSDVRDGRGETGVHNKERWQCVSVHVSILCLFVSQLVGPHKRNSELVVNNESQKHNNSINFFFSSFVKVFHFSVKCEQMCGGVSVQICCYNPFYSLV